MNESSTEKAKYCRREISLPDQPVRFCMTAIKTANALEWCDEHRAKLPLWPANDPIPAVHTKEVL